MFRDVVHLLDLRLFDNGECLFADLGYLRAVVGRYRLIEAFAEVIAHAFAQEFVPVLFVDGLHQLNQLIRRGCFGQLQRFAVTLDHEVVEQSDTRGANYYCIGVYLSPFFSF